MTTQPDNIAIAHKDYDVSGGGEILAETLADGFDAPLISGHGTGGDTRDEIPVDIEVRELAPDSYWHRWAAKGGARRALAHMFLWRDHADDELCDYDIVITSGNEPQWWVPREDQTVIQYTHSTPRWMYDLYHVKDGWVHRTTTQLQRWVFQQDMATGNDIWVANSEIVKRRMQRYWDLDSDEIAVVYPPIATADLGPTVAPSEDYYLSLSRLDELKHVDEAIAAANELGIELKVAGTGPEMNALEQQAGETVEMLGWVTGERKRELLAGARGLISCCAQEDFGMAVVEALASGTPVITVDEGMPPHTAAEPERGIHYDRGNLEDAIRRFERGDVQWTPEQMARWAARNFSTDRFIAEMQSVVDEAVAQTTIDPGFETKPASEPEVLAADD